MFNRNDSSTYKKYISPDGAVYRTLKEAVAKGFQPGAAVDVAAADESH